MRTRRLTPSRQPAHRSLTDRLETGQPRPTERDVYKPERSFLPLLRLSRYTAVRAIVLFLTVAVALYFTLLAANLGGKVDEVVKANNRWLAGAIIADTPEHKGKPVEERWRLTNELVAAMDEAAGLNVPIYIRVAKWMPQGMLLQLGQSCCISSRDPFVKPADSRNVRLLIGERLPNTLLLMGVTNLVFFFASLGMGLFLSRSYGSFVDKLIVLLSPLSSAPSWFYGIFLIAIFAGQLRLLPFNGMYPTPPPDSAYLYTLEVLKHMVLPFTAVFLSVFFYSVYVWRTFFLIYSSEDYVEMAKAKGLPNRVIERRYILRPSLPTILTSLVVLLIGVWSGSIILERLFNWPGLGDLYYLAIVRQDTAVIVGLTIVYAYFLAITIFVLDIAYALIDPRVRIGDQSGSQQKGKVADGQSQRRFRFWSWRRPTVPSSPAHPGHLPWVTTSQRPKISPLNRLQQSFVDVVDYFRQSPRSLARAGESLRELRRYPSALVGLGIILLLLGGSLYAAGAIPYQQAITLWRGDESDWHEVPRNARPLWFNYFSRNKLPESVIRDSRLGDGEKVVTTHPDLKEINLTFTFDFPYDVFPHEPVIYFYPQYKEKVPHVTATWISPNGREWQVVQLSPRPGQLHRFSEDTRLMRRLDGETPERGLFAEPDSDPLRPLRGVYQLRVEALMFEEDADFDAKFMVHGQVYGLAGTDHRRRDLSIALLWGTPIALATGLVAAVSTALLSMFISAAGVWRGGWLDDLVQRVTEVNMVLPLFPILAMFGQFFTLRLWQVMGLAILFTIFGSSIKTYRALFLQVKESPYIEAAQAYGAGNMRIILFYLLPRVFPVLIPQIMRPPLTSF